MVTLGFYTIACWRVFVSDGAKMVDPKGKEEMLKFKSKGHFRLLKLVVDVANLQLHSCDD